jgi:hypothetical protein
VYQVVKDGTRDAVDRGVRCVPAGDKLWLVPVPVLWAP